MHKTQLQKFSEYCSDGEFFEHIIQSIMRCYVRPGDIVVDGGASRGRHTFPLCKMVGKEGRVYAVEPLPVRAEQLKSRTNEFRQLSVIEAALVDFRGHTVFNYVKNDDAYSGIGQRDYPFEPDVELLTVSALTLDDIIPETEVVRFLKLDLEGGEFAALKGARRILGRDRPLVVFEHGGRRSAVHNGYDLAEFQKFWSNLDYRLVDLFGRPREGNRFADNTVWYLMAAGSPEAVKLIENLHIPVILASQAMAKAHGPLDLGLPGDSETSKTAGSPGARPLVTALINTYNYGRYLPFAINSVLNQTYPNIEIIVVDDGSTDHTREVLAQYEGRVRAIRTENGGQGHAFNVGISHTRGDLLMLLDADDTWLPEKVEHMVEFAAKRPEAAMLYHRFQNIDRHGREYGSPLPPALINGNFRSRYLRAGGHWWTPITSVVTLRTEHIRRALPLPTYAVREGADTVVTDYCALTSEIASCEDVLTLRRLHGANLYAAGRDNSWYRTKAIREDDVRRIEWRMFSMRKLSERLGSAFKIDLHRNEWRTTNLYWLGRSSLRSVVRACLSNSEHSIADRYRRLKSVLMLKRLYRSERI
jgi:FkbM family methyltransferase